MRSHAMPDEVSLCDLLSICIGLSYVSFWRMIVFGSSIVTHAPSSLG
jgi:hypothetical protein